MTCELVGRYQKPIIEERSRTAHAIQPQDIIGLMTPDEILVQKNHAHKTIERSEYTSFDSLLRAREQIRDLRLVPRRSPEVQRAYEQMGRDEFLDIVRSQYLNGSPFALVREQFPSDIPFDVNQYVLWINERTTGNLDIACMIADLMEKNGLSIGDVILFERSIVTETEYVKVAVPEFRHIHIWTRKPMEMQ